MAFNYDGKTAAQYADRWWNSANPQFLAFENDCSNFISQCLFAGGMPMKNTGRMDAGWWYQNKRYSYSWTTAHSLRWYLESLVGNGVEKVANASDLQIGDVISYDFEPDGVWNHSTIVTGFDKHGQPLVNAHTYAAQARPWRYDTSPAFTDQTQYIFWHIAGSSEK